MIRTKPTETDPAIGSRDDRPADDRCRQRIGGNHVRRLIRNSGPPGDPAADAEASKRRQNQPKRQNAAQHLDGEQRAAQRHAVGGRHAGSGAAGDQQPALFIRQASAIGKRVGDHGSRLLRARPRGRAMRPFRRPPRTGSRSPACADAGRRPAKFAIASVMSMLLPLESFRSTTCPMPVSTPAPSKIPMWRQASACLAASSRCGPGQARCCTRKSSHVRMAAPKPAPTPVRRTANQKTSARGAASVGGMADGSEWDG